MIVILLFKKVSRSGESDLCIKLAMPMLVPNSGTGLSAFSLSQMARACAFAPCLSGTLAVHPSVLQALLLEADMHLALSPTHTLLFLPVLIYLFSHRLSTYVPRDRTVSKTDVCSLVDLAVVTG